jgi:hypothetical protein
VVAFGDCVLLKIERKTFKKILCKAHLSIHWMVRVLNSPFQGDESPRGGQVFDQNRRI